jgi:hypothetical protein
MLNAERDELPVLVKALKPHRPLLIPSLWSVLEWAPQGRLFRTENPKSPDALQLPKKAGGLDNSLILRAACILANYDPESPNWVTCTNKICNEVVNVNPVVMAYWVDALRPIESKLAQTLMFIRQDTKRALIDRFAAEVILGAYNRSPPVYLDNEPPSGDRPYK